MPTPVTGQRSHTGYRPQGPDPVTVQQLAFRTRLLASFLRDTGRPGEAAAADHIAAGIARLALRSVA